MNVSFNCDGPVKVAEADFDTYKSLFKDKRIEMEMLFDCWFKETSSDGVRRLALRDMLRQPLGNQTTKGAYYGVEYWLSLGRFLNDLKEHDTEKTGKALTYRPKLLRELVDEFLYVAQHQLIPTDFNQPDDIDKLIEYLIPIVDEPTARQLFLCHSIWGISPSSDEHASRIIGDIVNDLHPEWLRNELWEHLKARYLIEIDKIKTTKLPTTPIHLSKACYCSSNTIQTPALYHTRSCINSPMLYQGKKDFKSNFTLITAIVEFLERNLPKNILYITPTLGIIDVVPRIANEEIVFSCARRHILNCTSSFDGATNHWLRFFYWAYGLTMHLHPNDTELLTKIDSCLEKIDSLT